MMRDRSRLQPQLGTFDVLLPHVTHAAGEYLEFADGRRLLDLNSGYWNVPLGYGRPSLIKAAAEAYRTLSYAHLYRRTHEPAAHLADLLARLTPASMCAKVLFGNDGTGATETALRLVMRWSSERAKADTVVVLRAGYHGDSLIVRQLGDYSTGESRVALPKLKVRKVHAPLSTDTIFGHAAAVLRRLEEQSRLAAFFCEIVQGVGGIRVIQGELLRLAQTICERSGALFVVDEVATGFARTGLMFAFEHHNLRPDLVLIGKALTNGFFPLSAVLVSERVSPLLSREFQHGHTTSGHPVGCVVAASVIAEIERLRLVQRARRLGADAMARLAECRDAGAIVRGLGLFIGVDVQATRRASLVRRILEKRGILVGQEAGVLTIVPPLTIRRATLLSAVTEIVATVRSLVERPQDEETSTAVDAAVTKQLAG